MRRRSCCDAPRHAFANLALKYRFTTCISAIYRDTFLRTARLWRSSRGGTYQIYRGRARAKCTPKFYPFASHKHLHALRIYTRRDAASATQKCSDAKYNSAGSGRAMHETSRERRPLDLRSRKPSKIGFLKFPLCADRKNQLLKFFRPLKF